MLYQCCEKNRMKKSGGGLRTMQVQSILIRFSIVLGMVAAVVTVLYFTPLPDQYFKSCDRPCHELDWPMICRIKLTIEEYQTMSGSCLDCPNNATHCNNEHCASVDGTTRGIITANRQLPGPSIQVCQNDILVVDVINKIPSHSLTVHWRGQPQHEAPFMDGVPMVTQCPITSYTTFQYKFRASQPGTHYWHAHSGSDRVEGIFGSLIVRQADKVEPHRKLYDIDNKDHVILISEWGGDNTSNLEGKSQTASLLINGKASSNDASALANFIISKGKRYRFRIAYVGGIKSCPTTLSIDKHLLKIIALDGNPIKPYEASSIILGKGERVDFVLKGNKDGGAYFLRVNSSCNKNNMEGLAVVSYENNEVNNSKQLKINNDEIEKKIRKFNTAFCTSEIGKVCLTDVNALKKIPDELNGEEVTRKIYLPFDYKLKEETEEAETSDLRKKIYRMNNLTFTYPSSPLLTQYSDVNQDNLCNSLSIPRKCDKKEICECIHIEYIPLGATVELILIDQGGDAEENVFHMHGYQFYVVGSRNFDTPVNLDEIKELDDKGMLFKRHLGYSVLKDTIRVPKFGVVAVRFIATNPGFWMLRDEQAKLWTRGLDIIFQVGDTSDMVTTPANFPTCGSWVGPDFFLI